MQVQINLLPTTPFGSYLGFIGVVLWALLNWSYTKAVFTDPGSTVNTDVLGNDVAANSVTVKQNGEMRYCSKCEARKPDRAHHCSTCRRCVLKMDHHCPWLAACVGLRNYKPFLLFLIYTSLFSWLCFWVSGTWLWQQVIIDGNMDDSFMPVHFVVLSVISGIIGLVLSGFTSYHIYLTTRNRTTIEALEKTRYLSPVRSHVNQRVQEHQSFNSDQPHSLGEQLRDMGNAITEIHANALPGVFRREEGEEAPSSPATASLRRIMDPEAQRQHAQYQEYLDERDSAMMPNAFNLGWRRNLQVVFGPSKLLWFIPVCNSIGDGWRWETNEAWKQERDRLRREREAEANYYAHANSSIREPPRPPPKRHRPTPSYDHGADSSDEEGTDDVSRTLLKPNSFDNWNDVPDDMLKNKGNVAR